MTKSIIKQIIGISLVSVLTFVSAACTTEANARVHKVSYYGDYFHGRKTANGERFNQWAMTTASNTHKMGTKLKVTNVANGKSVIVRVNDTGGFAKYGRTLDLSKGAFAKIAPLRQGIVKVRIQVIK